MALVLLAALFEFAVVESEVFAPFDSRTVGLGGGGGAVFCLRCTVLLRPLSL